MYTAFPLPLPFTFATLFFTNLLLGQQLPITPWPVLLKGLWRAPAHLTVRLPHLHLFHPLTSSSSWTILSCFPWYFLLLCLISLFQPNNLLSPHTSKILTSHKFDHIHSWLYIKFQSFPVNLVLDLYFLFEQNDSTNHLITQTRKCNYLTQYIHLTCYRKHVSEVWKWNFVPGKKEIFPILHVIQNYFNEYQTH